MIRNLTVLAALAVCIPSFAIAQAKPAAKSKAKATATMMGGGAKIRIVEPARGASVSSPVKIVLQATGVKIVPATDSTPGTGHYHLFVDHAVTVVNDTIPRGVTGILHLGRGQTEFVLDSLKPGRHRVIAVVGDFKHRPLKPSLQDTVTFTVK